MSGRLQGAASAIAARYLKLIEYFIPERIRADREAANQARMFLISHSVGPILGNTVPLAVLIFAGPRPDAFVLAAAITLFWLFPFLLRAGVRYDLLVLTSVVNLNFCILWSCYFYGGISSPTLPWLLIIPILSLFYVGGQKRLQPRLLAISAGSFALFLLIYLAVPPAPVTMPLPAAHGLGMVSTTAALCYVATMAVYYARIFDAGMHLETEVRRRKQATDELRRAVATADRAGSAKAEFLARMSHELRNPLNAVIGYSQILREDALDSGDTLMREDVERIHDAGQYLLRLINMILDLSKLEAGRMKFDYATHALAEIVRTAVAAKRGMIAANGNSVEIDIEPGLRTVDTDAGRLGQIVEAVVENAAQHTRHGRITVSVGRAIGLLDGFEIAVADTGEGIDPALLPTLFDTFKASRDASGGRYGGTGINLTVVKRLCVAMGGSITAESTPGEGSRFVISIPAEPPSRDAATPAAGQPVPRAA